LVRHRQISRVPVNYGPLALDGRTSFRTSAPPSTAVRYCVSSSLVPKKWNFLLPFGRIDANSSPDYRECRERRRAIAQLITPDLIFADGVDDLTDAVGAIGVVLEKNFENQRVVHCDAI